MIFLTSSDAIPFTRRGFSLIELLVTIAVIALLAMIIIPVTNSSRQSAQMVQNTSNLRSIGIAFLSYSADNDGNLPLTKIPGGYRQQSYYGMGRSSGVFQLVGESFQPGNLRPEGQGYVETADVFYGPFTPKFNELRSPPPSGFYERSPNNMYLGYTFYSLPVEDAGVGADKRSRVGPVNESVQVGDPLAPLAADHQNATARQDAGRDRIKVAVVHLNGSVSVFPEELNDLGSGFAIRYMANWPGSRK